VWISDSKEICKEKERKKSEEETGEGEKKTKKIKQIIEKKKEAEGVRIHKYINKYNFEVFTSISASINLY
jgi:hypothetical protein